MTTTNLEATLTVLKRHRDARAWSDTSVANDLLQQLGLDPAHVAANAAPPPPPPGVTEAEVVAHEAAAKAATDKAVAARTALLAQHELEAKAKAQAAADQAAAAKAKADAAKAHAKLEEASDAGPRGGKHG